MSEQTPAGWYPDPEDASHQRYWDGTAWTDHRTPATAQGGQWGQAQAQSQAQPQWGQQQPAQWTPTGPVAPPTPGSATTALVLGILSLVMCGLFTGIPAMIVGRNAKREIAASGGRLGGEGVANAGFITGLIGTLLSVLGLVFFILIIVVGISASTTA